MLFVLAKDNERNLLQKDKAQCDKQEFILIVCLFCFLAGLRMCTSSDRQMARRNCAFEILLFHKNIVERRIIPFMYI